MSRAFLHACLPALQVRAHPVLLGECLGGALYVQDFLRLCRQVGFTDPRQLSITPIEVGHQSGSYLYHYFLCILSTSSQAEHQPCTI